jgi:hypothetical protein
MFCFAFGLAGLIGLMSLDTPKDQTGTFLAFSDHLFAGGHISMFSDAAENWPHRATERRLFLLGIACGFVCALLLVITKVLP